MAFHSGLDLLGPLGLPVRASAAGRVTQAERRGPYGLMVEIDHGNGYTTRYGHLQSTAVHQGDAVARGQVVAAVGNTGLSTSPHLHFEIWFHDVVRNPLHYLERTPCAGRDVPRG